MHTPVLVAPILDALDGLSLDWILDGTFGLGGHSRAVLDAHPEARVIGLDRDADMLQEARGMWDEEPRCRLQHARFSEAPAVAESAGIDGFDAAILDLGVSSPQLDRPDRGFSFREDGPLDMRMDRSQGETARELLQRLPERQLADLLFHLGGERSARRIAKAIVEARRKRRIRTTGELAELVRGAARGKSRIDPATRTFQALRMAVNRELEELEDGLRAVAACLRTDARLLVVSFHSGEDRLVKQYFRSSPELEILTPKPLRPDRDEVARNPRSRSARLRIARRRAAA